MIPEAVVEAAASLTPEQVAAINFHPDIDPALVALVRGQAAKLAALESDGQCTVVHVHHHDIEQHARSYNEGYAAAIAHMADK